MTEPERRPHGQTSIYLNEQDRQLLTELQERTGLARSEIVRLAIRRVYYGETNDKTARLLTIAEEIKRIA